MYRVPYTGVSMSVALVRLHVLVKILFRPYLRVNSSIGDIDFRDLPLATSLAGAARSDSRRAPTQNAQPQAQISQT